MITALYHLTCALHIRVVSSSAELLLLRVTVANYRIIFLFHIAEHARYIHFQFFLDSDTALAVAAEMVEQLDLADHDVAFIADFIDFVIMRILPGWKPTSDSHSSGERCASGVSLMADQWETPSAGSPLVVKQDDAYESHIDSRIFVPTPDGNNSNGNSNFASPHVTFVLSPRSNNLSYGSVTSEVAFDDDCLRKIVTSKGSSGEYSEMEFRDLYHDECRTHSIDSGNLECPPEMDQLGSLKTSCSALVRKDPETELKFELDAIEAQYQQWFQELSRMKQEAVEDAKKRWMAKQKVAVH